MAKTPSARDEAAQAISEYVAGSYACLAQIEMAKRRLAELKRQVSSSLGSLADDLTHRERVNLLVAAYWDAMELPLEPVSGGLGLVIQLVLRDIPPGSTGIPCRGCDKDLTAKSRTQFREIRDEVRKEAKNWKYRNHRLLFCEDCWRTWSEERDRARNEERNREQESRYRRLAELRSMPYPLYLRSPEWQETRAKALKRSRYRCQLCGANQWVTLDVHHSTYERLGQELPADLIVLCRQCHTKHHTELPAPDGGQDAQS